MQKLKHIKYTKLSPIFSEIVPSPVESPSCRTLAAERWSSIDFGVFYFIVNKGVAT
jgi:hypothetical protein